MAASPTRLIALVILIAGLVLLILGGKSGMVVWTGNRGRTALASKIATGLALILGMSIGTATAMNAVLGREIGAFSSTFLFLTPGAVFLGVWFHCISRQPLLVPFHPGFLIPGALNVIQVAGGIVFIPIVGLQLFMTASFSGNMLTGLVIDRFGWFDMPVSPITRLRVAAAMLLLVGVMTSLIPS